MTDLSAEALDILINVAAREGATPRGRNSTRALAELQGAGLLGTDYGLTRKGVTARQREYNRRLDMSFGAPAIMFPR